MSIKIFAFDLDGTAILANKNMPDENRNAVIKAIESGVICVPCTGRLLSFLPERVSSIPGLEYVITCNGARVENILKKETIYEAVIRTETILKVFGVINEYDVYSEIYCNGQAYTVKGYPELATTRFKFPVGKIHFTTKNYVFCDNLPKFFAENNMCADKINLPYLPSEIRSELKNKLLKIDGLKLTSSVDDNIEINDEKATKGAALKALCEKLSVSLDDCMAIGDNGNDVEMLKVAGVSVAMGNASSEALATAKFVTGNCNDFGFRDAIDKFILNN